VGSGSLQRREHLPSRAPDLELVFFTGVRNSECEIIHLTPSRITIRMLADSSPLLSFPLLSSPPIRLNNEAFMRRDIYNFTA
jgi:hypothetical protein